jgi:hypothetical protein
MAYEAGQVAAVVEMGVGNDHGVDVGALQGSFSQLRRRRSAKP